MGRAILTGLFALGLLFAVVLASIYISTEISMSTAERRGEADKMERVEANGARRIANYEFFHNTCQDIQAKNEQIADTKDMLSGEEEQRTVFALNQTKTDMVGDYNSKASQDYTSGQFRDSDLPYQIDVNDTNINCG